MTPELKLENCWAFKTISEWKKAAREAGLVLRAPDSDTDSGDFPDDAMGQKQRLDKLSAMVATDKDKQIVITSMSRQNVRTVDDKGKVVVKEYLTVRAEYRITTDRGVPYGCEVEFGKYNRPNVVVNPQQRYDTNTGKALNPEKILSGNKVHYDANFELPKDTKQRKTFIDTIIKAGNTDPESIKYYYKDTEAGFRDSTYSVEQFTNASIDELRSLSKRGGGAKGGPGYYWRDGKLYDSDGNPVHK